MPPAPPRDAALVRQLALWRLLDSALPSGAFAHSLGVEACIRCGLAWDAEADAALDWLVGDVVENACALTLPTVMHVHAHPTADEAKRASAVLDAKMATNEVARKASQSNARGLARAAEAAFEGQLAARLRAEDVTTLRSLGSAGDLHHAAVFGMVSYACGVGATDTALAFLHCAARDATSALTRLGAIGPTAAATLLDRVSDTVARLAEEAVRAFQAGDLAIHGAFCATPVLELAQAAHLALQPRLFRS